MLDSMQRNPRPTRAEASDVANAIFDGTDAIMLSGETAAGQYPVESVKMMATIATRVEKSLVYQDIFRKRIEEVSPSIADAICQSVAHTALSLDVVAIVAPTESGHTAKMISKYRPKSPIIAVSADDRVCRRLALVWGVQAYLAQDPVYSTDEMLEGAIQASKETGIVKSGDTVVIAAGVPIGETGTTNLMKVHVVGEQIVKGQGIGRKSSKGQVVVAKTAEEALAKMQPGAILVTTSTDKDMMPAVEQASALVIEEGGLTSHAAVVGVSIGIPVIVGVNNATSVLKDGQEVTVDAARGIVYNGHAVVL